MYRKRAQGWLKHADFLLLELVCFQAAFLVACVMRHGMVNPYTSVLYRNVALVGALIQIFTILSFNIFHNVLKRGYYREFTNTVKTTGMVMLLVVFYLFVVQQGGFFSRIILIAMTGFYWAFSYLFRNIWKYVLKIRLGANVGRKSMVIISTKDRAKKLIPLMQGSNAGEFCLTGVILLDISMVGQNLKEVPVVADRDGAVEYLCRDWVDEVFFVVEESDSFRKELMNVMLDMSMTIHLPIANQSDFAGQIRHINKVGNHTVITMSSRILSIQEAFVKRFLDIVGGFVGCVLTGILFLFLAPAIYIQSPGPIFFSQMRVGRNGKLFRIYKFRSMYMDAEERKKDLASQNEVEDGMMFKIENDPRIIGSEKGPGKGIGNFIRKTSLDEFPQFLNVLKGDMSLVGTRPPTVDEWEKYNPHHRGRLSIKPGLTGMWQVSGRSDIQDFEEVVELDMQYIADWCLALDVKILLKTVLVVLGRRGSR